VKSNIDTSRNADINFFACLLAAPVQAEATKINISSIVAFLGYFYYIKE
jgi:hypothetical protein